ncbi:MAG: hypothetical protein IKE41_02840 [Clostridia bacterium]|nr:hypothetical protein [Clostridia bacterium]
MKSNEEKVKEFFNDKAKIKELVNDEKFISKVSGGKATAETYIDEFKKFDVNLTESEAKKVCKTTDKILTLPVGKLDDESVANVVGGLRGLGRYAAARGAITTSLLAAASAVLVTIPCRVATICCAHKAKKAHDEGNIEEEKRCTTLKNHLIKANCVGSGILGSLSVLSGLVVCGVTLHKYGVGNDDHRP